MHRIDSTTAREDVNGIGKKGFSDNADLPQHDATYMTPSWCNAVQEEIANAIEAAGITLDKNDNTQLSSAVTGLVRPLINAIYHVGSWHGSDNLDYDPAIALQPLLGETIWRLRPYIPNGVLKTNQAVKQTSFINGDGSTKASSTRIWQRMPDDYVDPIFKWERISAGIIEGDMGIYDIYAQFRLTTTGVAPGTQFAWEVINDPNGYMYLSTTRLGQPVPKKGTITVGQNGTATLTVIPHHSTEGFNHYTGAGELHYLDIQLETGDIATQGIFLPNSSASAGMSRTSNQEFSVSISRPAGRSIAYKLVFLSGLQYIVLPENNIVYLNSPTTVNLATEFIIHPENIPDGAMISGKFVAQEARWDGTYEERSFSCYVK